MNRPSARHVLPEFTERTSGGQRTLDPYAKLLGERIVFLGAPVDDTSANDVIAQLLYLEYAAPDQDISLYVNSPGGPISAMSAIYDTMQTVTCDIVTTCLGQAVSTAAVLLAAGTPGKRMALPGARVVVQQPSLPEPVQGQPTDLDIQARELLRLREQLTAMLVRHSGRSADRVAADLDRETVFDAAGAREYGLIDHIVKNRKASLTSAGIG
ncbi:ATP-dependent Clp protease proteolytic subunit [Streptomyces wuyuanensis]|uniref:ATP-dependent Clp protease proteolytic subunit n=1 Tax=Streptomyces wuyuanensis TaxID=1196353 RepID=A0A1G9T922_9ACTN|nr:ATP-dependent Clp protease proteolytic subunit [Streptomyces wuyuanensis]SDM43605.1 ATP-dependent Clp protease, protease subunit [Streptomyces wuyuanensis]